jgi:hydroxypyruvate reductase
MRNVPPSPLAAPREFLRALYDEAVAAADPYAVTQASLPERPRGRTLAVAIGKAAAPMARAFAEAWDAPFTGILVTPTGHGEIVRGFTVHEAAHPVPDAAGAAAAAHVLAQAAQLGPDDLLLCLLSGGGSAVMTLPPDGVGFADIRAMNAALLASGLPIQAMNLIRRHVSRSNGGRLALAAGSARVVTLAVSDVVGDDPIAIASGPTVADPTTLEDARALVAAAGLALPDSVMKALHDPANESPKPSARAARWEYRVIASSALSLARAGEAARAAGCAFDVLGEESGDSIDVARAHAARVAAPGASPRPHLLLSGGETLMRVTAAKPGRGGRCTAYLLALLRALGDAPNVYALAADTDGIDGVGGHAGAVFGGEDFAAAAVRGIEPARFLAADDSAGFFAALDRLIVTGPTRTNVNDFRAILVV